MLLRSNLYKKLGQLQGEKKEYEDKINNIFDILNIVPEDVELDQLPSVQHFLENNVPSRLDNTERQLNDMLADLREWISKNTVKAEGYVMQVLNKRTKIILFGFLTAIILLALAAIACTISHAILGEAFPEGDTIAEIIGTSDFVLGVIGFVVERFDDIGKREVRIEAEKVKAGEAPDNFIEKCKERRSININIGMFNKISNDTHNIYN